MPQPTWLVASARRVAERRRGRSGEGARRRPSPLDVDHVVVLDQQRHGMLDVALEREVEVARREHHRAVRRRARPGTPAISPPGQCAIEPGLRREAGRAGDDAVRQPHRQVGARAAGDAHLARGPAATTRRARRVAPGPGRTRSARSSPGARSTSISTRAPSAEDRSELGGVEQALDGAVEHQVGGGERRDGGAVAGDGLRRPGRADGHGMRVRGRRHDDVDHLRTLQLGRDPHGLDQHRPAGRLAQHGDHLARPQLAARQLLAEHVEPAVLGHPSFRCARSGRAAAR